jgi:hypothetical protein
MLIAEDLLLLLLDDESGKLTNASYLDTAVGGALLLELALTGTVEVVKGSGMWARARVVATDSQPPTDETLAAALATVSEKGRTAQDLVDRLGKRRRAELLARLEERGILRREEDKVLGLFPRTRWPAVDSSHEHDVRRQLGDAVVRGATPTERTAGLVALLSAMGVAHRVLDREGLSPGEVRKRAKTIADGDWAAKAVKDSIAAAQAAITAAMVASTAAATSGS